MKNTTISMATTMKDDQRWRRRPTTVPEL